MDFTFNDDQTQLRAAVRGYLERHNGFEARIRTSHSETGWNEGLWRAMAQELGITAAGIPEALGGLGSSTVDLMVIMEEIGANLTLEPYLETAIIAAELLAAAQDEAALSAIAEGSARYAFAWAEPEGRYRPVPTGTAAAPTDDGWRIDGAKAVVVGAPWATHLLVTARTENGMGLFALDPASDGVSLTAYPTIDGRRAADIVLAEVRVPASALLLADDAAHSAVERAIDTATAMTGAEALGVLRNLLDMTIDYTRQRKQFGKPISEFQVLQHRMVDMYMQLEMATSAVYRAVLSLDAAPMDRAKAVSAMKVTVNDACRFIGQNAIQLHGGMGMTDELPVGHYFKRATAIELEYGTSDFHLTRFAALSRAAEAA